MRIDDVTGRVASVVKRKISVAPTKISVASTFRWKLGLTLTILTAAAAAWIRFGPIDESLLAGVDAPSTIVVDRHGRVLYEALSADGTRARPMTAAEIPPVLEAATLAAEDRRFHAHPGVDPVALLRAVRHNLLERRIVEGGSTITQQTAKLLIQRREGVKPRGIRAKLREMVLALRLEHRFDKREILALYLNIAPYGNQTSGAGRASRLYFGVAPSMLTPAQAAFLAALPQRPTAFNPWKGLASARTRQQAVLRRMAAAGTLDPQRLQEAKAERIVLRPRVPGFAAPHFVEMVLAAAPDPAPARIETTIDLELQAKVEAIVARQRRSLATHGAANVAVVVLDNARGEWLAWEGSGDYADAEHGGAIDGARTPRQPGSALKPFTYALAFEQGRTPASVLPDIPTHFPTAQPGVLYSPRNYDGRYRGPLLARRALAGSQNIPAVALASEVGVPTLRRFLERAGISTFDRTDSYYGLGLTLGNAEVRLDELVAAYAAFARGGVFRETKAFLPPAFDRAQAREGGSHGDRDDVRLVSERTAFWITDILSDDEARAETFGRGSYLEFPFPVAVKTGTSQAYHDNWTIGYTREVTVGVWVGNFDRAPLRDSTGVTGAGPIFHAVMLAAVDGRGPAAPAREILRAPDGLTEETICALSGGRANPWCPSRAKEWVETASPLSACDWHHESDEGLQTFYPPQYRAWAAERGVPADIAAPAIHAASGPAAAHHSHAALAISSPPSGATYSIDPTLRREFQALTLRATTARRSTLTWSVDGAPIGSADSGRALSWPLAAGTHAIEVRDEHGQAARASIVVR